MCIRDRSGIVCVISNNVMEIASTDGNRLARVRETIDLSLIHILTKIPSINNWTI